MADHVVRTETRVVYEGAGDKEHLCYALRFYSETDAEGMPEDFVEVEDVCLSMCINIPRQVLEAMLAELKIETEDDLSF